MRRIIWAILILSLLVGGVYAALTLSSTTVFRVLNPSLAWDPQPNLDLGSLNAGTITNIPIGFKNLDPTVTLTITCSITGTGAQWVTWALDCPSTLGSNPFATNLVLTIPTDAVAGDYSFTVNVQGTL